ncbi:Serine/threonine-protein kinase STN7, chloroplastic-like protein [Drosera capensis]
MATIGVSRVLGLGETSNLPGLNPRLQCPYHGKTLIMKSPHLSSYTRSGRCLVAAGGGFEVLEAVHGLFLGVGVGLPCTVMECGDIIYRSTLPRPSRLTVTVPGVLLTLSGISYLWATPGFWDMFVLAFVERLFRRTNRKKEGDVVLKKATEYGAVEIWMNERVRRACSSSCADFLYGFLEVETMILGEVQDLPKGIERENRIIQTIMRQLLFALDGLHSTGIVHRDVKPQNIIFSEGSRTFKIIDLGAAADLRVGINYIPKEFLLDPRFDIYSTGLIFLQMAIPSFRSDSNLIQFNRQLKRCGYDLTAWRSSVEPRASPDLRRGFDLLDLDGGIGWELLTSMVRFKARQRLSARAALAHPYFDREGLLVLSFTQKLRLQYIRATQQDYTYGEIRDQERWRVHRSSVTGAKDIEPAKKGSPQRNALASALMLQRKIVRTINESIDEISQPRKSMWWNRWIPRQE